MTPFIKNSLRLLNEERISEAISYIRKRLIADRDSNGLDSINQIESTYNFMLKYLIEGQPDPGRERLYGDIKERLFSLVRYIEVSMEINDSPLLYYSQSRINKFSSNNFPEALGRFLSSDSALIFASESADKKQLNEDKDRALRDIFSIVWTLPIGRKEELSAILKSISDKYTDPELAALLISGLTLNLLTVYDRDKLIALLDSYPKIQSAVLNAKLLTGVILVLSRYSNRVKDDYELKLRFDLLNDNPEFIERVRDVVFSIVKARGALNLMKKIESEILPDLMKVGPKLWDKLKNNEGEINIESMEMNPEWEKLMEDKSMQRKLRRLNDIHENGGDVMLPMFSQISSRIFFFNEIDSWFRTFSDWEADRLGVADIFSYASGSSGSMTHLTDVDKFAMAINFSQLNESMRALMKNSIKAQTDQILEEMKSKEIQNPDFDFEIEALNYARTLFRFYNFFRLRQEFYNPFNSIIDIRKLPFLGDLIADDETLGEIGEYCLHQGFYEDAISIFSHLADAMPLERGIYCQKIGFAYEKLGKFEEAFRYYTDISLEGTVDEWLMKKIYKISKGLGNVSQQNFALTSLLSSYQDDQVYLIALIRLKMDNPKLDLFIGDEEILESRKLLNKAYFLFPENKEVLRFMARYACRNTDYEEAKEYLKDSINEISMYLAEKSLSVKTDFHDDSGRSDEDLKKISMEEREMAEDLIEAVSISFAQGDISDGINFLSEVLMMENAGLKRNEIKDKLIKIWEKDPVLSEKVRMIPLYIDAARKVAR